MCKILHSRSNKYSERPRIYKIKIHFSKKIYISFADAYALYVLAKIGGDGVGDVSPALF